MTTPAKLTLNERSWESPDGARFYIAEWLPAQPRAAILLVHGLGDHCRRYDAVAGILGAAGIATLGFDMRGHGRTSGKRGHIPSMEQAMADMDHFFSELQTRCAGIPHFVYGQSMGGMHALYFALTRKPAIAGVISSSPALAPGVPVAPLKLLAAKLLYNLVPALTLDNGLELDNLSNDPAVVAAYKADPFVTPLVSARLGLDVINKGQWVWQNAEQLALPTLIQYGGADHMVSVPAIRNFVSRAPRGLVTAKEWPGLCHETHNEAQRAEVVAVTQTWIENRIAA